MGPKSEANAIKIETPFENVAPDGGWGYIVALSTSAVCIFTVVPMAAFGIIFGNFLKELGDEVSGTTVTNGMFNTVFSFTGLLANHMLSIMSCRKVAMIGAVTFFIGAVGIVFCKTLLQLVVSFGIIQGVGFGLMMPAVFTSFNLYFDKRRTLMMNVAQTLMVAAIMLVPHFAKLLMDNFGFRGTIALCAALSLHCVAAAAVLHPVKWYMKTIWLPVNTELDDMKELEEDQVKSSNNDVSKEKLNNGFPLCDDDSKLQVAPLFKRKSSHFSNDHFSVKSRFSLASIGERAISITNLNQSGLPSIEKQIEDEQLNFWQSIVKKMELNLFTDPKYLNISLGTSLSLTSDLVFISLLPLLLGNLGYGKSDVTYMMTVYFGFDLISRITFSALSAIFTLRNRLLFLFGSFFSAVFRTAFVFEYGYWWTMVTISSLGFLRCLIQTPLTLVFAEEYPTKFASAFSLFMVINGVISLIFGPLAGFVKSATKSDKGVIHLLSAAYMLCVIPWTIEIIYSKIKNKK